MAAATPTPCVRPPKRATAVPRALVRTGALSWRPPRRRRGDERAAESVRGAARSRRRARRSHRRRRGRRRRISDGDPAVAGASRRGCRYRCVDRQCRRDRHRRRAGDGTRRAQLLCNRSVRHLEALRPVVLEDASAGEADRTRPTRTFSARSTRSANRGSTRGRSRRESIASSEIPNAGRIGAKHAGAARIVVDNAATDRT